MSHINTVAVSGNLTRDPQVKWVSEDGDKAIVGLGIANNRSRKGEDGDYVEETSFFDIDVFGGFGVLVAKKLRKGDSAAVQGRLEQQTWGEGDAKRSKVVVIATTIDSDGFFRSADENAQVVVPDGSADGPPAAAEQPAAAASPSAAPSDDDIPF